MARDTTATRASVDMGKSATTTKMSRRWSQFQDSLQSLNEKVQQSSQNFQDGHSQLPVHGRSLEWLHELADDPTHNLSGRMPTGSELLVLYICPVPGSNDMFLSPMKPSQDRVTPEDISSAMYILHQEDLENFHSRIREAESPADEEVQAGQRESAIFHIQRKPLRTSSQEDGEELTSPEQLRSPSIRRKQVKQSEPVQDRTVPDNNIRASDSPTGLANTGARSSFNMLQTDMASGLRMALPIEEYRNLYGVPLHHRDLLGPEDAPMSLLRKRSNNNTSVVSRMIDPNNASRNDRKESNGLSSDRMLRGNDHMYIDVLTNGYTSKEKDASYIPGLHSSQSFTRRLARSESTSPTSAGARIEENGAGNIRGGRAVANDTEQIDYSKRTSWRMLMQRIRPHTRAATGFGFQSPWSMRCEFVPSAFRDNVIKCVSDDGTLSELRYHIIQRHDRTPISPARGSGELDLSLGRAALGGGSNGELAKLAKLVVYPEGMKMLDLIISANMLVFQRLKNESTRQATKTVSPSRQSPEQ